MEFFILVFFLLVFILLPAIAKIIQLVKAMLYSAFAMFFKMVAMVVLLGVATFFYFKLPDGLNLNTIAPPVKKEVPPKKEAPLDKAPELLWVQNMAPPAQNNTPAGILLTGDDSKDYLLKNIKGKYYIATSPDSFKEMRQTEVSYREVLNYELDIEVESPSHLRRLWGQDGGKYFLVWRQKKWFLFKAVPPIRQFNFEHEASIKV